MDSHLPPAIKSFIIRFVVEDSPQPSIDGPKYRGAIRHIQTDEELNFSSWQEAVDFIQRFVQLGSTSGSPSIHPDQKTHPS